MQNYNYNLGELRSVHRPLTFHIWMWLVLFLAPLMLLLLSVVLTLEALTSVVTQSQEKTLKTISNSLTCVGLLSLLLAILGSILISDYREWSATRTVKLRIYQAGFTYESKGQMEVCRWDEIKDINYRFVPSYSKAFPGSKVKVIRSIVRRDGTAMSLAKTLNLIKITELITAAKKKL
jgi:hypothetical protein